MRDAQTTTGQSETVVFCGGFFAFDVQVNANADDRDDLIDDNCDQDAKMHN